MQFLRAIITFAFVFIAISPAKADLTWNQLTISKVDTFEVYIWGIINGLDWANSQLVANKQKPLYCELPGGMSKEAKVVAVKKYVEDRPRMGNVYAGLVIMKALMYSMPCSD